MQGALCTLQSIFVILKKGFVFRHGYYYSLEIISQVIILYLLICLTIYDILKKINLLTNEDN